MVPQRLVQVLLEGHQAVPDPVRGIHEDMVLPVAADLVPAVQQLLPFLPVPAVQMASVGEEGHGNAVLPAEFGRLPYKVQVGAVVHRDGDLRAVRIATVNEKMLETGHRNFRRRRGLRGGWNAYAEKKRSQHGRSPWLQHLQPHPSRQ